jgi:hypothetical protein
MDGFTTYDTVETFTYDLYVNPPGSNADAAEDISGDTGDRFNYL